MATLQTDTGTVSIRLARTQAEIESAQRLRYEVFYEEHGAKPSPEMLAIRRDFDAFDTLADHLIVVFEHAGGETIVGTYRLINQEAAKRYGQFYPSAEYDLAPLLNSDAKLLELGRSCVLPQYRTRPIMQLLWQGIAEYVTDHRIDLLFGCASLHGTDLQANAKALSYLYHYHLAPADLRPRALGARYENMNILPKESLNLREVFSDLPPLIKGYLRVGARIGDGAVIDAQFNTTDVCIIMQTNLVTSRYRKHYERKIQKPLPGGETDAAEIDGVPAWAQRPA
mgnify:FL=1